MRAIRSHFRGRHAAHPRRRLLRRRRLDRSGPSDEAAHRRKSNVLGRRATFASASISARADDNHVEVDDRRGLVEGRRGYSRDGSAALPKGVAETGRPLVRPVRGMTVRVSGFDRSDQAGRCAPSCEVDRSTSSAVRAAIACSGRHRMSKVNSASKSESCSDCLRDALDVVPSFESAPPWSKLVKVCVPRASDLESVLRSRGRDAGRGSRATTATA